MILFLLLCIQYQKEGIFNFNSKAFKQALKEKGAKDDELTDEESTSDEESDEHSEAESDYESEENEDNTVANTNQPPLLMEMELEDRHHIPQLLTSTVSNTNNDSSYSGNTPSNTNSTPSKQTKKSKKSQHEDSETESDQFVEDTSSDYSGSDDDNLFDLDDSEGGKKIKGKGKKGRKSKNDSDSDSDASVHIEYSDYHSSLDDNSSNEEEDNTRARKKKTRKTPKEKKTKPKITYSFVKKGPLQSGDKWSAKDEILRTVLEQQEKQNKKKANKSKDDQENKIENKNSSADSPQPPFPAADIEDLLPNVSFHPPKKGENRKRGKNNKGDYDDFNDETDYEGDHKFLDSDSDSSPIRKRKGRANRGKFQQGRRGRGK